MHSLTRLKARIGSLKDLREIIKALRGLAASHVQEAQGALPGIRSYVKTLEDAISEAAALRDAIPQKRVEAASEATRALVLISSEHGFVGSFNEQLLQHVHREILPGEALFVVGLRGAELAAAQGLEAQQRFEMATRVDSVLAISRRIARDLEGFDEAAVVFAGYRSGGAFQTSKKKILPLSPDLMSGSRLLSPPLHHLDPIDLLKSLAEEYLLAEITHCMMESLASENGARLRATHAADHNIGDRLGQLTISEQVLRQETVTNELLELVTATESLEHPVDS